MIDTKNKMIDTKNTIQRLKELGLFDNFKKAMEILVEETDKPQHKWDNNKLNLNGLKHKPELYRFKSEEYPDINYYWNMDPASLNTATEYFEAFKPFYSDNDEKMSGLDFGCIKWNPHLKLKEADNFATYDSYIKGEFEYDFYSHYQYIKKVIDISFSCFYGKTPKEILDILDNFIDK